MENFYNETLNLTKKALAKRNEEARQLADKQLERAKEKILNAAYSGYCFCTLPESELNDIAYQALVEMGFSLSNTKNRFGDIVISWEEGVK